MKIPGSGSTSGSYICSDHTFFIVKAVIYGKEKFYGCEKPILIEKNKKFSLIKLVCVVFF